MIIGLLFNTGAKYGASIFVCTLIVSEHNKGINYSVFPRSVYVLIGNSTLKTKQRNTQSRSPASTPSTSKKKQNINSEETIQELYCSVSRN